MFSSYTDCLQHTQRTLPIHITLVHSRFPQGVIYQWSVEMQYSVQKKKIHDRCGANGLQHQLFLHISSSCGTAVSSEHVADKG